MKIYHAQVNHLTNPIGFRMERVTFNWKVNEAAGKKQTAAKIQIARDAAMTDIILDTGFDPNADSLCYEVALALEPRTRYYWTVTVQTDAGEEATSEVQFFETAKREEAWEAAWISCDKNEKRHPKFTKTIVPEARKSVKAARLYICGLGLYEAYYNDERIGDEYLTPYSNDYNEWVQYQTYDVTEMLQEAGTLAVTLGNGWYKGRFGFFTTAEDEGFYSDEWKLLAELRIQYEDGTETVIGTDETWDVERTTICFSNLYDGEHRDDTLPALPLTKAILTTAPSGELTERMSVPVRIRETFKPVELIHTPVGEQVLDLGQEFTGIFALDIDVPKGTVVHIQTGEILQEGNFYNANLRTAKSEYFYTSGGEKITLVPKFTFFGYRYVKIEGIENLEKDAFTGLSLYSELTETAQMTTGHSLLNRFIENVRWGLQGNFVDVPTDCPQRDERMGWTGDAQVFSATANYLKDTYAFYAKYLYDMAKEQSAMDGMVPNTIPSMGLKETACVWGEASCIIPWNLYLFYGDKNILKDQFESMRSWVDYVKRVDGDNHAWRYVFHFGDWLALDNPIGGAEQCLGGTDEEFIANLYYAVGAEIVAKAAKVLGYEKEEAYYRALAEEQYDVVKTEYYSPTGRCCIKTQTALLLTLKYHLSPNVDLTKKQLLKLYEDSCFKLKTGFVGTPLMCNILSDNGMEDIAYRLLLNEDYPGWLREVKLGATTVWERWNSLWDDGTISGISMNSMNHYSYGSVVEWMYRRIAGFNTVDAAPGCRFMNMVPLPNWQLRYAESCYDSPAGKYESRWELTDPEHITLKVTVPFGCCADLTLPYAPESVYEDTTNPMFANVTVCDAGNETSRICHLEPGTYEVSYQMTKNLYRRITADNTSVRELLDNAVTREALKDVINLLSVYNQYMGYTLNQLIEVNFFTTEQVAAASAVLDTLGVPLGV